MSEAIFLIGGSGSGKSTIENELTKYGFSKIVSHTSRPMREGDIDGKTYYFVDKKTFLKEYYIKRNFIEKTKYNGWYYGVHKHSIGNDKKYVMVVDPKGFNKLKKVFDKSVSFYIDVDSKTKLLRSLNREEKPDCKEICRRFISDLDTFNNIKNKVDYIINNDGDLDQTVKDIIELYYSTV